MTENNLCSEIFNLTPNTFVYREKERIAVVGLNNEQVGVISYEFSERMRYYNFSNARLLGFWVQIDFTQYTDAYDAPYCVYHNRKHLGNYECPMTHYIFIDELEDNERLTFTPDQKLRIGWLNKLSVFAGRRRK